METKCGIDFNKKLSNLSVYDRFDYIRKQLIKSMQRNGDSAEHLSASSVRKSIMDSMKIPSKRFTEFTKNIGIDIEAAGLLANIIDEDINVLIEGTELKPVVSQSEEKKDTLGKKMKRLVAKESEALRQDLKTVTLVNHTDMHLSIEVVGGEIHIWYNMEKPSAKIVIPGMSTFMRSGKESAQINSERINYR